MKYSNEFKTGLPNTTGLVARKKFKAPEDADVVVKLTVKNKINLKLI